MGTLTVHGSVGGDSHNHALHHPHNASTLDVTAMALKAAQTHDQDKLVMSVDNKVRSS